MATTQEKCATLGERFDANLTEKTREIARLQKILENQQPGPFLTEREVGANIEHREAIIRDLQKKIYQQNESIKYLERKLQKCEAEKDAKIAKLKKSKRTLKRQLKKAKKQAIPARPNVR